MPGNVCVSPRNQQMLLYQVEFVIQCQGMNGHCVQLCEADSVFTSSYLYDIVYFLNVVKILCNIIIVMAFTM